jgi:hypothetical protein
VTIVTPSGAMTVELLRDGKDIPFRRVPGGIEYRIPGMLDYEIAAINSK